MTWLERIITAFENIPEQDVKYSTLYQYFTVKDAANLPTSWKSIIQRTIQDHSSDSKGFKNRLDVFSSVNGLGSGIWRLNPKFSKAMPKVPDLGQVEDHLQTKRVKTEIFRVLRDTKISKALKELYNHNCQICGERIESGSFIYSEAHHIRPLGEPHNGPDSFDNLIILCPNHHAEFDYGIIGIEENLTIVHKNIENKFASKLITQIKEHKINSIFLRYHMKEIYSKRD
ncbi:MAG: HNH endonuclease [Flavobacteriales bacterium]|nr:MAG: HNH endonuclease [Flavobacteriales bacterium]